MNTETANPFAAPNRTPAPVEEERWGIAQSGPPVNPAEVETADEAAEVVVMWGDADVLHVEHVSPYREVAVGEAEGCAYLLGEDILGTKRLPIVVERFGKLCCVVPDGAEGRVELDGASRALADLETEAFDGGARLYPLPAGATAWIHHRGFTFLVRPTAAGRDVAKASPVGLRRYGWIGLSLGVHALLVGMFYFLPPSSQALSLDSIGAEDRMVQYLQQPAAVEQEELPAFMQEEQAGNEGGDGQRAADEEGAMGDPDEQPSQNRYAVQQRDSGAERLARDEIRDNMQDIAAIGALRTLTGMWNAPTSPYGADSPNGSDAFDAVGLLMGAQAGPAFGQNGAGMRGTGRGAGGTGLGTLGLGRYGTLGHGANGRDGNGYGDGSYGGAVQIDDHRVSRVPPVREGRANVVGGMSPDAIRRVVRRHLAEVRFCYEQGLQQNPSIEGRVTVSWIISPTGGVQSSSVSGSTLGNERVESCMAQAVRRWTFPTPDGGGPVGVNYPFVLQSPN